MANNQFAPTLTHKQPTDTPAPAPAPTPPETRVDGLSQRLATMVRATGVLLITLLPIFFWPGLWGSLSFQKVLLAVGAVAIVISLLSLLALRFPSVKTVVPLPWIWFVGFVAVSATSALLSESLLTSFRGAILEPGTVLFLGLLALVMGVPLVFQGSKRFIRYALQGFVLSACVVLLYVVVRLFVGPVLSFGSFGSVTVSPLGAFNDLAVFAGLSVLIALVGLLQLPLRLGTQLLLLMLTTLSLVVLAAVNFFFVWLIVGFFGLVTLLYIVSRDRLLAATDTTSEDTDPSYVLLFTTTLVCLASAWFIVMGDVAGAQVSRWFDVSYLEVRPSFTATVDIISSVYEEEFLLGVGPNQFVDAWRQYKNASINETIFWATDFTAGSSYVTTIAATSGVLGLAALLLFHGWFVWFGLRMLFRGQATDRFWYFIGVTSFTAAGFLWLMTYLYVPGATILLLAAFMTGLTFVASAALLPQTVRTIPLVSTRQRGFALMAVAIFLISGSVGLLFTVSEQYLARASFNQVQAGSPDVAILDQAALSAYGQFGSADFLGIRARIALLEMNEILAVAEPSEAEQQRFFDASGRALTAANQAIAVAPQNPEYHAILAGIYNNLALAGVSDALERMNEALATAKQLDPQNPTYSLVEAQMAIRRGEAEIARTALETALSMKRNFSEALFLLAELDIATGDTESAIATTEAIIRLEPNNPTRYYQLGILEAAAGNVAEAIGAYSAALELDPQFANARYFRAILLANDGDLDTAVSELEIVQASNQDNEQLASLITELANATSTAALGIETIEPVAELSPEVADETVTSPVAPESDLLTPLNTVPTNESEEAAENSTTPVTESEPDPATTTSDGE